MEIFKLLDTDLSELERVHFFFNSLNLGTLAAWLSDNDIVCWSRGFGIDPQLCRGDFL